jgi:uncharacterized phage protein (TIGR01671 family)
MMLQIYQLNLIYNMREIKFRAWDILEGMIYGNSSLASIVSAQELSKMGAVKLMQYTGLKDKNGKEIYEGDIVKIYSKNHKWAGMRVVEWDNERAMFSPSRIRHKDTTEVEIIGNIYENEDLLTNK